MLDHFIKKIFAYLQGPGNGSNASTSSSSGGASATAASAAAASASSSNRLEMPFASVPESVPALSGGGSGKGKGANGSQMADAVPATLPPRKNYDDDSNGGLRHAISVMCCQNQLALHCKIRSNEVNV